MDIVTTKNGLTFKLRMSERQTLERTMGLLQLIGQVCPSFKEQTSDANSAISAILVVLDNSNKDTGA